MCTAAAAAAAAAGAVQYEHQAAAAVSKRVILNCLITWSTRCARRPMGRRLAIGCHAADGGVTGGRWGREGPQGTSGGGAKQPHGGNK